jgi:TPR repeat protein
VICRGCEVANYISNGVNKCPFCREPAPYDVEERDKRLKKRMKANDPAALREMGRLRYGEGDYDGAFEYWTNAAELGDVDAHDKLGMMYMQGQHVEEDEGKAVYHFSIAAIGGHHNARYALGYIEGLNGNFERAVKHFIIAANLGCADSMKILWKRYACGDITKEDLDATIRTHQAAIDETKSEQRDRCSGKSWSERRYLRS